MPLSLVPLSPLPLSLVPLPSLITVTLGLNFVEFFSAFIGWLPVDIFLVSSLTPIEIVGVLLVEGLLVCGGPKTELNPPNASTLLFFNTPITYSKK